MTYYSKELILKSQFGMFVVISKQNAFKFQAFKLFLRNFFFGKSTKMYMNS